MDTLRDKKFIEQMIKAKKYTLDLNLKIMKKKILVMGLQALEKQL